MKYTNIIYLKSGVSIEQGSNEDLAKKMRLTEDWDKGTIYMDSSNSTVVPKREVKFIDTILNKETDS